MIFEILRVVRDSGIFANCFASLDETCRNVLA